MNPVESRTASGGLRKAVTLAVVLSVLAGCSGGERHRVVAPVIEPTPPSIPSLTVEQLLAAPDSLRVGDTTLTIVQLYAWRSYNWLTPADSSALSVGVTLDGSPPGTFPTSVSDVYLWAIRDSSEVWSTTMGWIGGSPDREYSTDSGPFWPTGILIDVVIGVRTSPTQVSLLLLRGVPIHKVT